MYVYMLHSNSWFLLVNPGVFQFPSWSPGHHGQALEAIPDHGSSDLRKIFAVPVPEIPMQKETENNIKYERTIPKIVMINIEKEELFPHIYGIIVTQKKIEKEQSHKHFVMIYCSGFLGVTIMINRKNVCPRIHPN